MRSRDRAEPRRGRADLPGDGGRAPARGATRTERGRRGPLVGAIAAALLALGAAGCLDAARGADGNGDGTAKPPPASVVVAPVEIKDVSAQRRYIGTVKAIQSVDLKARVEGFLEKVAFEQGGVVKAGQTLYQIEQAPYQAKLDNAEGQLAAAKAQLASAQATLEDKQADFERQETLVEKGDVSKTAFDRAKAERDEASAAVEEAKASVQQAKAAIKTAEINLGYTEIRSPIDGRIGATKFTQGNLVDSSSGTLATVVQVSPIRAVFSIPSADYVKVQQRTAGASAKETQATFVPELVLPTGETYPEKGRVAFIDNQIDASTGTIAVYTDFPNPDSVLLPGQFVTAVVSTAQQQRDPVVPAAAIQRTRDGEQVYLVGDGNRIELRTIKTGAQVGNGYAVSEGLQGGEVVVVSGIQKVKPGEVVKPVKQSDAPPMGRALSIDSGGSGSGSRPGASSGSASGSASGSGSGSGSRSGASGDAASGSSEAAGGGSAPQAPAAAGPSNSGQEAAGDDSANATANEADGSR